MGRMWENWCAIIVVSNTSNQTEQLRHGIKLLLKIVSELLVYVTVVERVKQGLQLLK